MQLLERNRTQLNKAEISHLQRIAEFTQGRLSGMAQGVLCFSMILCIDGILSSEKSIDGNLSENNNKMSSVHNTHPYERLSNPTDGELIVEIAGHSSTTLTIQAHNDVRVVKISRMEVFDLTNRKIHQQTVNKSYNMLKMNEL